MSRLPSWLVRSASEMIGRALKADVVVHDLMPAAGGCINNGGRVRTSHGDFFMKWNDSKRFPGMFRAEARGLELLAGTKALRIPTVIGADELPEGQLIVMEHIGSGRRNKEFWRLLGNGLVAMHTHTRDHFGLDHDNYIGSLPQSNSDHGTWLSFFVEERLRPQLRLLTDHGKLDKSLFVRFERLFGRLTDYFPAEKPALLHGDLWSGNLIIDEQGGPCLIDPAVYYGHREAELAFTQLFGGFDPAFYEAYEDVFPLEEGFDSRVPVYNLYPLLVHANLFGGGYLAQAVAVLMGFG